MNIAVYSAIFLATLVALSLVGRLVRKQNGEDIVPSQQEAETYKIPSSKDTEEAPESEEDDEECCGEHEVCEKGKIKRDRKSVV